MIYPDCLYPTKTETFILNDKIVETPKCAIAFERWTGDAINETFGGKPIVCFDGKPMFAELAIMNHFIIDGWEARWVETYGRGKKEPVCLHEWKDDKYRNQVHQPILDIKITTLLVQIAELNSGSYSGCWDVLAWKDNHVLFAESKRNKKDSMRTSQNNWLKSALQFGLKADNFLVVQWDLLG